MGPVVTHGHLFPQSPTREMPSVGPGAGGSGFARPVDTGRPDIGAGSDAGDQVLPDLDSQP
jgi:hypothetical protein